MSKIADFLKLFKEPFVPSTNPASPRRERPREQPTLADSQTQRMPEPIAVPRNEQIIANDLEFPEFPYVDLREPASPAQTQYSGNYAIPTPTGTSTFWTGKPFSVHSVQQFYDFKQPKEKPMTFDGLTAENKVAYIKQEYNNIVKSIFDHPETLKQFVINKKLSNKQAKEIFGVLNTANTSKCGCCRQFDPKLLKTPLNPELEPIIDMAQANVKSKYP